MKFWVMVLVCGLFLCGCGGSMKNTMDQMTSAIGMGNEKGSEASEAKSDSDKQANVIDPGTPRAMVHAKLGRGPVSTYKTDEKNLVEVYRYENKSELKEQAGDLAVDKAIIYGGHILPGGTASLLRTVGENTSESVAKEEVIIKVEYDETKKVKTAKRVE